MILIFFCMLIIFQIFYDKPLYSVKKVFYRDLECQCVEPRLPDNPPVRKILEIMDKIKQTLYIPGKQNSICHHVSPCLQSWSLGSSSL